MNTIDELRPQKLRLEVIYRTPSLNLTKRRHWSVQRREQHRAWGKLLLALQVGAAGSSTQTISPLHVRTCLMASSTLASFLTTHRIISGLRHNKRRSRGRGRK